MQSIDRLEPEKVLNCEGYASPMPLVQTKKAIEQVESGGILEIIATDKDSVQELQEWATETNDLYIGFEEKDDKIIHYIKKASSDKRQEEKPYKKVV